MSRYEPSNFGFDSLEDYQSFHGLKPDGIFGEKTQASMDAFRFCGLADNVAGARGTLCKWNKAPLSPLTYAFQATWPMLSDENRNKAFEIAWNRIESVCGVRSVLGRPDNCDILIKSKRLDGRGGTLAQAQLPCSNRDMQLWMEVDEGEKWILADNPSTGFMDIIRVVCHELCHNLGVGHIGRGNLMAPMYDVRINRPQAGDAAELVARLGLPNPSRPVPPPGEIPEPPKPSPDDNVGLYVKIPIKEEWIVRD